MAQGLTSENGLAAINGLTASNGLVASNSLQAINGLSTINGLSAINGLMTSDAGRSTADYLAKCSLANGDYIDKQDNYGTWRRYYGRLGVGTVWKNGTCDEACQQRISACMMAHMNSTGNHVPIFINGDASKFPSCYNEFA